MEFIYKTDQDQIKTSDKRCTPKEFLLSHPRGVYTLGVLSELRDFDDHLDRLCHGVLNLFNENLDIHKLWKLVKFTDSEIQSKFRFTLLIYMVDSTFVFCLYADEPIRNKCTKALWVYGDPRDNPQIKESGWIRKRQYILDKMPNMFQEAILSRNNCFYEGLTSNICFVFDSGIKTIDRSLVLPGLYLKKVENVCKALKIPFEEGMVTFDDLKDCIGIFITSIHSLLKVRYGPRSSMDYVASVV